MSSFASTTHLFSSAQSASLSLQRHASSLQYNSKDNPLSSRNKNNTNRLLKSISKPLAITSATAAGAFALQFFGGNRGGGGVGFWRMWFGGDDNEEQKWDPHGVPVNLSVELENLNGLRTYKLSEILLFDRRLNKTIVLEDPFSETIQLRPGGIYTKKELETELKNLSTCGLFEEVDIVLSKKSDGTLICTIPFKESIWEHANKFKCINVGQMAQAMSNEIDLKKWENMTNLEKWMHHLKNVKEYQEYQERIQKARPCMLPMAVQAEISRMLKDSENVSIRLLQRIRDKVQKWYHDEGYACAQVVNFGNLNSNEVVCEVVEGDITKLIVEFEDKRGNVVEGDTPQLVVQFQDKVGSADGNAQLPVVKRDLIKELRAGNVYNIEAGKQIMRNISSLYLFSKIGVITHIDEKNSGGIIVEIKLKELDLDNNPSGEYITECYI